MKLLAINIVLVILHIDLSKMVVIQKLPFEDELPDNENCNEGAGSNGTENPLLTESCSQDPAMMGGKVNNESLHIDATEIAREAAAVAKAALEAQDGAAHNASCMVKLQLANKAVAYAQIAIGLFLGKQAIFNSMAKEIQVAEETVALLSASIETSRENALAAAAAFKLSNNHTDLVVAMLADIKSSLVDLDSMIEDTEADLEEKRKFVEGAKAHGACLREELAKVETRYQKVKAADIRAATAAVEAEQKVGNTTATNKGKCAD